MTENTQIKSFDSTISLFFNGYNFIGRNCERYQSDIFETRLRLKKVICLRGQKAAEIFYDKNYFQHQGDLSFSTESNSYPLDFEPNRYRKAIFLSLMTQENIESLSDLTRLHFQNYSRKWEKMEEVVLFDEIEEILCRTVCDWAGIPLKESEVKQRTRDFETIINDEVKIGWLNWRGSFAKSRAEYWAKTIIEKMRGRMRNNSAASLIANTHFYDGSLFNTRTAAAELLNILRLTVAVARYIVFAAHALYKKPELIEKLKSKQNNFFDDFLKEIYRFYPFFPFEAAFVKNDFYWNGYHFPKKRLVILDRYSTNHDPNVWTNPQEFRPERFNENSVNEFDFGNFYFQNTYYPGEWMTIALMKEAVEFLISSIEYKVPPQNLYIDLTQIPTLPESRFLINNVKFLGYFKYKSVGYPQMI